MHLRYISKLGYSSLSQAQVLYNFQYVFISYYNSVTINRLRMRFEYGFIGKVQIRRVIRQTYAHVTTPLCHLVLENIIEQELFTTSTGIIDSLERSLNNVCFVISIFVYFLGQSPDDDAIF